MDEVHFVYGYLHSIYWSYTIGTYLIFITSRQVLLGPSFFFRLTGEMPPKVKVWDGEINYTNSPMGGVYPILDLGKKDDKILPH